MNYLIILFVLFCFVFYAMNKKEFFSSHNSDFIPEIGIFNNTLAKISSLFSHINLTTKPDIKKSFADKLGFITKQKINNLEFDQIISWIKKNLTFKFIKFDTLYKEKDIIYAEFYLDINDPVYYLLVSLEIKFNNTNIHVYNLIIKGLKTKLNIELLPPISNKTLLYNSFIDEPEILKETTIRNQLQIFEENKKEILLRNKNVI